MQGYETWLQPHHSFKRFIVILRWKRMRRSLCGLVLHVQLPHKLLNSFLGFLVTRARVRHSLLHDLHGLVAAMWVVRVWDVIVTLFFHHFYYHSRIVVIRHFTQTYHLIFLNASNPMGAIF